MPEVERLQAALEAATLANATFVGAFEEAARLHAENAELKVLLRKVLEAHPHIEPKPGCGICQALDEHESLKWGE